MKFETRKSIILLSKFISVYGYEVGIGRVEREMHVEFCVIIFINTVNSDYLFGLINQINEEMLKKCNKYKNMLYYIFIYMHF